MDAELIAKRVLLIREELGLSQKAMAEKLGISYRSWQGLEGGRNVPSGETLLQFKEIGINPGWVLTGLGPKDLVEDESYLYLKNAIIDGDLLLDIKEIVMRLHKEVGIFLKEEDIDRKAIQHYNEYMLDDTDMSDLEEVTLWLRMFEKRLNRELLTAAKAPGSGKQEAS